MKLTIIGTGYVGLTSGVCFAELGNTITCVDIDAKKIANLKKGILPIYEPGLEELIEKNKSRLEFTTDIEEAIKKSEIIFSAVGTPPDEDYRADLKFVKAVAKSFGENINSYKIFVNKSTVPVGTGAMCKEIIINELKKRNKKIEFDIVSNPEFLKEGEALSDTLYPDRVVVGTESDKAREKMKELYSQITEYSKETVLVFTDIKSAEIIKYASNSFLATKISFINEMSNFTEKVGGNIKDIAYGMGLDKRIGKHFLNAGIGYGGSCFPKDVKALIQTGKDNDYNFQILNAVEDVNARQKVKLFEKLKKELKSLKGKTITIWGLSFKPNTDDIREAASLSIIENLIKENAIINVFDPISMDNVKTYFPNINYIEDKYDALNKTDALMILTEWDEFKDVDFNKIKSLMKNKLILDGRNVYDRKFVEGLGFKYISIG